MEMMWLGVKATVLFVLVFVFSFIQALFWAYTASEDLEKEGKGIVLAPLFQLFALFCAANFTHHIYLIVEHP